MINARRGMAEIKVSRSSTRYKLKGRISRRAASFTEDKEIPLEERRNLDGFREASGAVCQLCASPGKTFPLGRLIIVQLQRPSGEIEEGGGGAMVVRKFRAMHSIATLSIPFDGEGTPAFVTSIPNRTAADDSPFLAWRATKGHADTAYPIYGSVINFLSRWTSVFLRG